jgi:ATP-dependent DNA helicase RecG
MASKKTIVHKPSETDSIHKHESDRDFHRNFALTDRVSVIKGIGPKTEKALSKRSIRTIEDLVYFVPTRYTDRRHIRKMDTVTEGEETVIVGRVQESGTAYARIGRKRMYYARVTDETGCILLKWFRFNRRAMTGMCAQNSVLFISGKVTRFGSDLQIIHPHVTVLEDNKSLQEIASVMPIYPEVEGISQGSVRNIIREAFSGFPSDALTSLIPNNIATEHDLPSLADSLRQCHFPDGDGHDLPMHTHRFLGRVIIEEFFLFQVALRLKRLRAEVDGIPMKKGKIYHLVNSLLPFTLTSGQKQAMAEIEQDMASPSAMNRLLQGDVGSGKTVCAILASAVAVDNGYQTTILAPTEVLAEQHYVNIHTILSQTDIPYVLLTGSTKGPDRSRALDGIRKGEFSVVIGTHALLQEKVVFRRLGLAVIDEQHRFGVIQRSSLKSKGGNPHVLVMTATPIPRSLSLVVYGDLDVSLIRDMPPGRQKCITKVMTDKDRSSVEHTIIDEITKGHQVYAIYPVIDDSGIDELKSAKVGAGRYQTLFPSCRVGLLHGKMSTEEKRETMTSFRDGKFDILVSTTVVEVGVDVANASLMVIEHAERFGLAQLHQLRGRVGRGSHPSKCILMSSSERTSDATKRLRILEKTGDGFVIAEEDLKLRGPGEMLGVRQAGVPQFRIGNIVENMNLMIMARNIAEKVIEEASEEERAHLLATTQARWGEKLLFGEVL